MAEIHLTLGEPAEAESLLAPAPDSLERSLLLARAALAQNRPGDALRLAAPANTQAPPGPLRATARLILARVKAETGETVEAVRSLVDVWLRSEPDSPYATEILQTLEEIGGLDAGEITRLLVEWASGGPPRSAAAAQFAMAAALARQSHFAEAQTLFMRFSAMHTDHPLAAEARIRTAEVALAQGDTAAARTLATASRDQGSLPPPPPGSPASSLSLDRRPRGPATFAKAPVCFPTPPGAPRIQGSLGPRG